MGLGGRFSVLLTLALLPAASEGTPTFPSPFAPEVTAVTPASGSTIEAAPSVVILALDAAPDPVSVTTGSVTLVRAGADLALGTADDVPVEPTALAVVGNEIRIELTGQPLPDDQYRIVVRGTEPAIPNLTNWWKLDESAGSTALDSAGSAPGTLGTGGTSPTWTAGRLGGGLAFAGADNRVAMGAADLPVPWTAAMWVNRTDSPVEDARLMDSATSSLRLEQYNHTNRLGITAGGSFDAAFNLGAPVGQWTHVTFVCEPSGTSVYLDGAFKHKIGSIIGCPRAFLGSSGFNAMVGTLDDVRLFSRKLTQAEITAVAGLGGVVRSAAGTALDGDSSGASGGNFVSDFMLATPLPVVTAMTPAPGGTVAAPPATISITANGPLDPATVSAATVLVVRAGPDTALGTGDDVVVVPTSVALVGTTIIDVALPAGLPDDQYRVVLSAAETATSGLVNHWKFDEGSGVAAADSTGVHPGTLGGAGGTAPLWRVGRLGNAVRFDGFQDRVFTGAGDLSAPFTAAMWVRREDSPVEDARLLDSTAYSLRLEQFNHTGRIGVTVYGAADTATLYSAPVGAWVHLAFVGESDGTSLYVNGAFSQKVGTVIGCPRAQMGSGGYNSMVGLLDDVRIFNRALTSSEVDSVANAGGGVRNTSGLRLDGEFAGTFPSGNGAAGGDFAASFTVDSTFVPPVVPPATAASMDLTAKGCGLLGAEILIVLALAACSRTSPEPAAGEVAMKAKPKVECVDCDTPAVAESALPASEAEWKKKLTPEEFYILRQKGTERPYTGKFLKHAEDGFYTCAGCGQKLYDSKTKYDSCGWPSFWDALPGAVVKHPDLEATCSRCSGHLGHIFDDGPPPTGKRH